jgi:archaellum component FlaD/FlaE
MEQEIQYTEEKTLSQWLMFMLERVGHNNLPMLLDYYENLGWISMDVSGENQLRFHFFRPLLRQKQSRSRLKEKRPEKVILSRTG